MRVEEQDLVDRLRAFAQNPEAVHLIAGIEDVHPEDIADGLMRLDADDALTILQALHPDEAATILVELPSETARAIINELPDTTVAHYLDILPMDDAVDLRSQLDPERFEALLNVIPSEDAEEIRRLLSYPEGSAGQIMTEDYVEVGADSTMAGVLDIIRQTSDEDYETVNYIYVLGPDRHLLGVLTLRRVIRANPVATAREVMNSEPLSVPVEMPEEEVARILARYGFSAIPVLDVRGRMVGIVTADDAHEVLEEAETEDLLAMSGVIGDAEAYLSLSPLQLVQRRLPWLAVLFVAEFFTGSVLRHYAGESETGKGLLAQLMLFVPLLIGAGGNAGSQVTTTITRALALGEVRARDWGRVIRRELLVSTMIGLLLGLVGFCRAYLPFIGWQLPIYLSLVVGLALPVIIIWAACVGSLLPIGAKALKQDPAVMSAPFISTLVDAPGLIIYFEVAKVILAWYGLSF